MVPGWFFMVPGRFLWVVMVPGQFFYGFSRFPVDFSWFQVGLFGFSRFQGDEEDLVA